MSGLPTIPLPQLTPLQAVLGPYLPATRSSAADQLMVTSFFITFLLVAESFAKRLVSKIFPGYAYSAVLGSAAVWMWVLVWWRRVLAGAEGTGGE
ncbi:hypothetical protein MKZ38_005127 [Zalerion maritima]|uniref:Uncharacterized protein n=1 Tax=Zalerion maritima TaxID=339359 RepID=A0AAD5WQJ8_9PEZI|nr:hypothetical protein MKZ38_005127 [Zalerion maritima]